MAFSVVLSEKPNSGQSIVEAFLNFVQVLFSFNSDHLNFRDFFEKLCKKNDLVLALVDAQREMVERDMRLQLFNTGKYLLASGQIGKSTHNCHC
jgi:choline kinase